MPVFTPPPPHPLIRNYGIPGAQPLAVLFLANSAVNNTASGASSGARLSAEQRPKTCCGGGEPEERLLRFRQLEMFVYLVDVPEELGPPSMVSRTRTTGLPAKPNWYPREDGADSGGGWVASAGSPDLHDAEVRAAGPAGTVVAWATGTFHRGTALTLPRGARYTLQLAYRPARAEWGQRMPWVNRSHEPEWYRFVHRATPRQLALFGFPPPGHPYWTEATLAGTAQRYPGLNMTPWQRASRGEA
jgi:hypothetical protein